MQPLAYKDAANSIHPVEPSNPLPVVLLPPASSITATAATLSGGSKTVASTATPETLVGAETLVDTVIISPLRTNTGEAFIGFASGNGLQNIETPVVLQAPPGKKINLAAIYVDVTVNGEGVRYETLN
jgi:hypothetical protein